ncbi:MAG: serine/threonine protein kinase [Polyangiaceae bacterium]|nr:serine/threonine protein kinase [Polyangiaceae bacterium]
MSIEAGQLIGGKVRLRKLLGRGGMGSVWLAHHETLDIEVAVKFIAAELLQGDAALVLARFRREAQLAAKLDNAHTVRVHDHGITEAGVPYIVMELLRGASLAERLHSERRLEVDEAVRVVTEVADGLDHAHAAGIIHRDIKPPNIYLAKTADGRAVTKILDFGIAKSEKMTEPTSASTNSGVLIGTPHYMSPEQLMRAGPSDKSADVWALAVVAYEMLIGKPPFTGETLAATVVAITQGTISMPTKVVPSLAPALDAFFGRALHANPRRRFTTAGELAEAFASAARGTAPAELPTLVQARGDSASDAALPTGEFLRLTDTTDARSAPTPESSEIALAPTEEITRPDKPPETPLSTISPRDTQTHGGRWLALVAGAALAGVSLYFLASRSPETASPTPPTSEPAAAIVSAEPPPSAAAPTSSAAPSSSTPAVQTLGTLTRTPIAKGFAPLSSVFVPGFDIAREEGDEGARFMEALHACERRKMALCTEAQWERACEAIPLLATRASWTLTPDDAGIAVRGGDGTCRKRSVEPSQSKSPERIAPCCTRAVGMTSQNTNEGFLLTTSGKVLTVERLVNAANGSGLADLAAVKTNAFGNLVDKTKLAETIRWMGQNGTYYFDSCDAAVHDAGALRMWTADCVGLLFDKKDRAMRAHRWLTYGDGGLIEELREPKARTELDPKPE